MHSTCELKKGVPGFRKKGERKKGDGQFCQLCQGEKGIEDVWILFAQKACWFQEKKRRKHDIRLRQKQICQPLAGTSLILKAPAFGGGERHFQPFGRQALLQTLSMQSKKGGLRIGICLISAPFFGPAKAECFLVVHADKTKTNSFCLPSRQVARTISYVVKRFLSPKMTHHSSPGKHTVWQSVQ